MPHLNTRNAILRTSSSVAFGYRDVAFQRLSVAFGELFFEDIGASVLERLNAFISFRSFSIYISVTLDISSSDLSAFSAFQPFSLFCFYARIFPLCFLKPALYFHRLILLSCFHQLFQAFPPRFILGVRQLYSAS